MLDASTFQDTDLINLTKANFTALKIDAETDYGQKLFSKFNGTGYPLIIFLNKDGIEVDRFYGYLPTYEFIIKMENVISEQNTFTYYLEEYNKNNHSAEILRPLANKYKEQGDKNMALELYKQLITSTNISKEDYKTAQYNIASLSLRNHQIQNMIKYLDYNQEDQNFENGVYDLLDYYKSNQMRDEELKTYITYLPLLNQSYRFLNRYAWRMTEINQNLKDALNKINMALLILTTEDTGYANILDTKAEILWKMGNIKDAVLIIEEALRINPNSEYYQSQKEKFLQSTD
ncbi:MAG: hypothetical protein CMG66_05270 [Candidatus Marinimicrobia bacterium]|nr:hypothetical protein [Candidatus Neomarinimicrobiota bacterium]|tara:strand:- start:68241 stop:69110 length:870 start_codon:yes stop_codon:yes gene_type:complete